VRFINRAAGVDDANAVWFIGRKLQVSVADSRVKGSVFGVEAVCLILALRAAGCARETLRNRQIEEQSQIRSESVSRQSDNLGDHLRRKVSTSALLFTIYSNSVQDKNDP
jgi:hypothetical protein